MRLEATDLPEVLLLTPERHRDARGWLLEAWRADRVPAPAPPTTFAQDNLVESTAGVLRGLHLQHPHGQGKLVMALVGEIFDVAVDVRVGSPRYGRWVGVALSAREPRWLWIPPGFAHGYAVTGPDPARVLYRCTVPHRPDSELAVRWDDPALAIAWPVSAPLLSARDSAAPALAAIDPARLPRYAESAAEGS